MFPTVLTAMSIQEWLQIQMAEDQRLKVFLMIHGGVLEAKGDWLKGQALRECGWIQRAAKPSVVYGSCWALCFIWPFLVDDKYQLIVAHRGGKIRVWGSRPQPFAFVTVVKQQHSPLCMVPLGFPQEMCFFQPNGQMHNLFHRWMTVKVIVFLMSGTDVNKTKKHGLCVYWKHWSLCAAPASYMLCSGRKIWCVLTTSQKNAEEAAVFRALLKLWFQVVPVPLPDGQQMKRYHSELQMPGSLRAPSFPSWLQDLQPSNKQRS